MAFSLPFRSGPDRTGKKVNWKRETSCSGGGKRKGRFATKGKIASASVGRADARREVSRKVSTWKLTMCTEVGRREIRPRYIDPYIGMYKQSDHPNHENAIPSVMFSIPSALPPQRALDHMVRERTRAHAHTRTDEPACRRPSRSHGFMMERTHTTPHGWTTCVDKVGIYDMKISSTEEHIHIYSDKNTHVFIALRPRQ